MASATRFQTRWLARLLAIAKSIAFKINRPDPESTAQTQRTQRLDTRSTRARSHVDWFGPRLWPAAEFICIAVLFTAWAGIPPDVNESHYLTKAKHFWNPDWCPGDLFLGSAFAHWFFYLSTGWITKLASLEFSAWLGRLLVALLMATGWMRLMRCFSHLTGAGLVSATLFLLLNTRFNLAGEWVIGGFEAKGLAYAFVLFGITFLARGQWRWVWPCVGIASAFHVLVGGWSAIAMTICFLFDCQREQGKVRMQEQRLPIAIGLAIALLGILPPLIQGWNVEAATASAAHQIYVRERISHHLIFSGFQTPDIAKFALIASVWAAMSFLNREPKLCKLNRFCLGSLIISLGGLLLSGIAESDNGWVSRQATSLLRLYWFRLSDFAVPFALVWMTTNWVVAWLQSPVWNARRTIAVMTVTLILLALGLHLAEYCSDIRPNADKRTLPTFQDQPKRTLETFQNWVKVCDWIQTHTDRAAVFITPHQQQTFKWYAGRTEVVCWKDIPQDAESIIQWRERVEKLILPQKNSEIGLLQFSDKQLVSLGTLFNADYLIVPQADLDRIGKTELVQAYPANKADRTTYVVLRLR